MKSDIDIWGIVGIAAIVIYVIGAFCWGDFIWPLTVVMNLLADFGIGYGTPGGYPWQ